VTAAMSSTAAAASIRFSIAASLVLKVFSSTASWLESEIGRRRSASFRRAANVVAAAGEESMPRPGRWSDFMGQAVTSARTSFSDFARKLALDRLTGGGGGDTTGSTR
jgi:hypothetical protein